LFFVLIKASRLQAQLFQKSKFKSILISSNNVPYKYLTTNNIYILYIYGRKLYTRTPVDYYNINIQTFLNSSIASYYTIYYFIRKCTYWYNSIDIVPIPTVQRTPPHHFNVLPIYEGVWKNYWQTISVAQEKKYHYCQSILRATKWYTYTLTQIYILASNRL